MSGYTPPLARAASLILLEMKEKEILMFFSPSTREKYVLLMFIITLPESFIFKEAVGIAVL